MLQKDVNLNKGKIWGLYLGYPVCQNFKGYYELKSEENPKEFKFPLISFFCLRNPFCCQVCLLGSILGHDKLCRRS